MNTRFTILVLIMAFHIQLATAQSYSSQRTQYAAINIGLNGVLGGLGAVINKRPSEKFGKVLLKGFSQGCLGGAFVFLGKDLSYKVYERENVGYAWPARIISSIGNSIAQNSANNINFWENWHFNMGFVRLDFNVPDKKFQSRFLPVAAFGILKSTQYGRFNLGKSIAAGVPIFVNDTLIYNRRTESLARGVTTVTSIAVYNEDFYRAFSHELVHALQHENMVHLNSWATRLDSKLKSTYKFYNSASKYMYVDLNALQYAPFVVIDSERNWICRYIEREAEHYSLRTLLPDCN